MKKHQKLLLLLVTALILGFTLTSWARGRNPSLLDSQSQKSLGQYLQAKSPFNILLLGYGGGNHDGVYLTDSMMVAHVNPKSETVTLLSVPRDIWIKIPTNGADGNYWKINAAYTIGLDDTDYPQKLDQFKGLNGGANLVKYMVEQVIGVPIDYYLAMDFDGFKKAIDQLGGVDLIVAKTFDDPEYPIDGQEDATCGFSPDEMSQRQATMSAVQAFPCRYLPLHFDTGSQHLNGERALEYVRSRHSIQDGTDFGRSQRQRNLIVAVEQKLLNISSLPNLVPFLSSLKDNIRTDLPVSDAYSLVLNVNDLKKFRLQSYAITDENFLRDDWSSDGQAILLPNAGQDNWLEVHKYVATVFSSVANSDVVVKIENGTNIPGLANLASNRLANDGLNTTIVTATTIHDQQTSQIFISDKTISQAIIDLVKNELGTNNVIESATMAGNKQIVVIIGQNYNQNQGKKLLNEP